jgi:hypothetical protein
MVMVASDGATSVAPPCGLANLTWNASLGSIPSSRVMGSTMEAEVLPKPNVSVPVTAVKSALLGLLGEAGTIRAVAKS